MGRRTALPSTATRTTPPTKRGWSEVEDSDEVEPVAMDPDKRVLVASWLQTSAIMPCEYEKMEEASITVCVPRTLGLRPTAPPFQPATSPIMDVPSYLRGESYSTVLATPWKEEKKVMRQNDGDDDSGDAQKE